MITPDRGAAPPSLREGHFAHPHPRAPAGLSPSPSDHLLDAVAAARHEYASQPRRPNPSSSGRFALIVFAAMLVGAVTASIYPAGQYITATFAILGADSVDRAPVYRQALFNFAWLNLNANRVGDRSQSPWRVDAPSPTTLRWWFDAKQPAATLQDVRALAMRFVTEMADQARVERETPTEAETALASIADSLHDHLKSAQDQLTRWAAQPSTEDPRGHREQHLAQWTALQAEFLAARAEMLAATSRLKDLEAQGEPTEGSPAADERRAALEADHSLQQDLRELQVHLSELKLQVLNVWQQSAAPLERWINAADALVHAINPAETVAAPQETAPPQFETFHSEAKRYAAETNDFATTWSREFAALRRAAVDPFSGQIIDTHERLTASLSRFLFDAGKRLASLRECLRTAEAALADDARQYVRYSRMARAFENAQNAHHRFEFAAGALTARDNYALDSAWRAAAGLRRRAQQQRRVVEETLSRKARARAVSQYHLSLADARRQLAEMRQKTDQLVDRMVATQEAVNLHVELSEDFLRRSLSEDAAQQKSAMTAAQLERMEQQRLKLSATRLARFGDTSIALVECAVAPDASQWTDRGRVGLLAGLVCLLILVPAEFWMRKSRP